MDLLGSQHVSNQLLGSPTPPAIFPGRTKVSDDDLPLSEVLMKNEHFCEGCCQSFSNLELYWTHKQQYENYEYHRFFSCCNVFSEGDHVCGGQAANGDSQMDGWSEEKESENEEAAAIDKKKNRKKCGSGVKKKRDSLGVKEFKCEECVLSFARERGLKTHMRAVHKRKRRCYTCEQVFPTETEYWEHVRLHDPADRVVCGDCLAEFSTVGQYRVHARSYPDPHNFKCTSCLRQFKNETKLDEHVCVCTNGHPLLCGCGKEFTTYPSLVEHARGSRPFHCCCCEFVAVNMTNYIRHVRKHSRQKPFECPQCGVHFSMVEFLRYHVRNVHGVRDSENTKLDALSCATCREGFPSEDRLRAHLTTHEEERVPCPECGKTFRAERIEKHRAKHKRSASLCPDCGRLFETNLRLSQHLASAHNSDPVTCDHCGKVLKTKKILMEHLKTHLKTQVGTRVAQAVCPVCGLKLAQKGSLARHILLVHERHKLVADDTPRLCRECGMMLPNKAKYYTHRRQHRALVERFPCPVCRREFNKKQNLVRHIHLLHDAERQVDEPNYSCDLCSRFFRERKNLVRHYRLVHKINDYGQQQ